MQNRIYFFTYLLLTLGAYPTGAAAFNDTNTIAAVKTPLPADIVPGVTDDEILLGSVLPLDGRAAGIGLGIQAGLNSALAGQSVGERRIHILYKDDLYNPILTPIKVRRLLKQGVFAMIGNVGTPTAAAALPILKQAGIPAVGFFTGATLLRPGDGPILNYRASYAQETAAVIDAAINAGVKPEQVCAYVQNDAYGRSGLIGVVESLQRAKAPQVVLDGLKTLLASGTNDWLVAPTGINAPVNTNGPVGVYTRNRSGVMSGYTALKNWEHKTGYNCTLVVTLGTYDNLAFFIHTIRALGESWIVSAVSFTGADNFLQALQGFDGASKSTPDSPSPVSAPTTATLSNVIMSQVVPLPEANLPIVQEARNLLGADFGFASLEGYIVGKMMLELLRDTPTPLTQANFMQQAKQAHFDLGGVTIDFTSNGYQGSDLVTITKLTASGYRPLTSQDWREMLAWHPAKLSHTDVTTTNVPALPLEHPGVGDEPDEPMNTSPPQHGQAAAADTETGKPALTPHTSKNRKKRVGKK